MPYGKDPYDVSPTKKPGLLYVLTHNPLKPATRRAIVYAVVVLFFLWGAMTTMMWFGGARDKAEDPQVGAWDTLYKETNDFSVDFLSLWLAGSEANTETLASMSADYLKPELPPTPYEASSVKTVVLDSRESGDADLFDMKGTATVVAPGGRSVDKKTYTFTVARYGETYKALSMPAPVNNEKTIFGVDSAYDQVVNVDSPLGNSISAFVSAYLTPGTGTTLASTVTSNFDGSPLASSQWSQAAVESVKFWSYDVAGDPASASEGDSLHAMVWVKASTSGSTFSPLTLPLKLVMQSNGQWAVDAVESSVEIGGVDTNSAGGSEPAGAPSVGEETTTTETP